MGPKIHIKEARENVKRIITVFLYLLLFLPHPLKAADYPILYLGSGYREYLSDKTQEGFYVDTFAKIDQRQKERVNKRNQVEQILAFSSQAMPEASNNIAITGLQHKYSSDALRAEVAKYNQQRIQIASAESAFTYLPYADGKVEYFKDGLRDHTDNERVLDSFGNVNLQNTYNMKYNENRLLIGYEATTKDNLGKTTSITWQGAYTPDSVFYGGDDTNANRNLLSTMITEKDQAGSVTTTTWLADNYQGKFLRAFSQTIEQETSGGTPSKSTSQFTRTNIRYEGGNPRLPTSYGESGVDSDGAGYRLARNNINYGPENNLGGYSEERWDVVDGKELKSATEATYVYNEAPDRFGEDAGSETRLVKETVTLTAENADGSSRTETKIVDYSYDKNYNLVHGNGKIFFKDNPLTGSDSSQAPDIKEQYGSSDLSFEIISGKPVVTQETTTTYTYDPESETPKTTTQATYENTYGIQNNAVTLVNSQQIAGTQVPYYAWANQERPEEGKLYDPKEIKGGQDPYTGLYYDKFGTYIYRPEHWGS